MDARAMIDLLNEDLRGEYQAILMYNTYAAAVSGPYRPTLKPFFAAEIADELLHAAFLAQKVASLGGMPVAEPRPVPVASDARTMLENVVAAEQKAIADYKARAAQAEQMGDIGLRTQLENMVQDETGHYEETVKILRGW